MAFFKDEGAKCDHTSRVAVKVLKAKILTKITERNLLLKKIHLSKERFSVAIDFVMLFQLIYFSYA